MTTAVGKGGSVENKHRTHRKPGQSDSDRTLGNIDEKIQSRLKTIESTSNNEQEDDRENQSSDMYEHIKDAKSHHDAQVLDVATTEQLKEQSIPNLNDEEPTEELTNEDVDMKPDDSESPSVRFRTKVVIFSNIDTSTGNGLKMAHHFD